MYVQVVYQLLAVNVVPVLVNVVDNAVVVKDHVTVRQKIVVLLPAAGVQVVIMVVMEIVPVGV